MCGHLGLSINMAGKIAESSLANAGVLHLASAAPNLNWGLSATQQYLDTDVVESPLRIEGGHVMRPSGPGLGVQINEAALRRFLV